MVTCANCGTQFDGAFCPNCGTRAGASASSAPPVTPKQSIPSAPGLPANWASVLCYAIPLVGPLICLVLAPYNQDRKIRFDAWQGLMLQIAFFVTYSILGVFYEISWALTNTLHVLLQLAYFALVIYLAVKAYSLQKVVLPVIGPFADKQK